MPDLESKKEDLNQLNPKKDQDSKKSDDRKMSDSGDDTEDSDDDSGSGDFGGNNASDETNDVPNDDDDKEDEPHFIKIIKDDVDEAIDDETRTRLLSNTRDDLVKTDRKISEIINEDGQQEKDLRIFEAEKEVKKTTSDKKELKQQQRTKIDILRRVTSLFHDKNKIPSNSIANNQQKLLATGLTANDVTVKDKQLKHKVADEKHHHHDHHKNHDNHKNHHDPNDKHAEMSFVERLMQQNHNNDHNSGGRGV
jgi:hypothetical protein